MAFAAAALDAGARMDLRDDLLKSTPLVWAQKADDERQVSSSAIRLCGHRDGTLAATYALDFL